MTFLFNDLVNDTIHAASNETKQHKIKTQLFSWNKRMCSRVKQASFSNGTLARISTKPYKTFCRSFEPVEKILSFKNMLRPLSLILLQLFPAAVGPICWAAKKKQWNQWTWPSKKHGTPSCAVEIKATLSSITSFWSNLWRPHPPSPPKIR